MATAPRTEESIFAEALEQPSGDARAVFLDAACGGDAAMRRRVEKLLKSHSGAGSFLNKPIADTADEPVIERPGTKIGPYKLLQQIGEGGMGIVYMADQEEPVRRRVALKIIKPGLDSRQVIARFEAERQALAMMDHQNIAKVLDAGTTASGRPYFVMDLVHGVPLTKFCEANRLTPHQRLELFVPVCHAIQHAHQKGIIHRDIKPSNILVTMYDDKPVPKVIDFGVAKAMEQRLTERTLFTQYGTLVGTFEYMSPEQAEMNAFGVDTRSDIYSLGVLLYELLTGTTPLERERLREAALNELVRLIKEEEPPRPSIRLSTSNSLPKVAAACRTEPARLSQLLRGELDWIVMKCLEKDRTRRYETANSLARDVERYLHDEPVEACPPSPLYRLRKFARKHRGLLTTAAGFLGLLITGLIIASSLAAWAVQAQRAAEQARIDAETALANERVARAEAIAAKERAESFSKRLTAATQLSNEGIGYYYKGKWALAHQRFAEAAEAEPDLSQTYTFRGTLYTTLGLWDRAAEDYDRRLHLSDQATAQTWFEQAVLRRYVGDEPGYREAIRQIMKQHRQASLGSNQLCVIRACTLSPSPQPEFDAAETAQWAERLVAANYHPHNIGPAAAAHMRAGNFEKAATRAREAIELGANSPGNIHRFGYVTLAMALQHLGQTDEARQTLTQADQAIDEWTRIMLDGSAGTMPISWSDWLDCLMLHREAHILINGSAPPADPRLATIRNRALAAIGRGDATTFMTAGREQVGRQAWDEAASSFNQALDQLPMGFRASSREMGFCVEMVEQPEVFARLTELRPNDPRLWNARGRRYANRGEWANAASDYTKTLQLRDEEWSRAGRSRVGGDWSRMGRARAAAAHELAYLLVLAGDQARYRELCTTVMNEYTDVDDPTSAHMLARACTLLPDAVSDWSIPLRLGELCVTTERPVAWHLHAWGAVLYRAGRAVEAIEQLGKSLDVHPTWIGRGQNYAMLALAYCQLGRHDEAREWLARTKSWLDETNETIGRNQFGYAASDYLSDWLGAQVLLREAESLIAKDAP
jgi:serine/threonine protein kinase/tetratricopeptide (TPR) repeat protein